MENQLILSEYIDFLFYKKQVIVYNSWNGSWVKMPISLYDRPTAFKIKHKKAKYSKARPDLVRL